jgi:hypothetical protein
MHFDASQGLFTPRATHFPVRQKIRSKRIEMHCGSSGDFVKAIRRSCRVIVPCNSVFRRRNRQPFCYRNA